ncbi:MAG: tetratricopeptide repeat protein [Cyclobacteriaceae bacterium]
MKQLFLVLFLISSTNLYAQNPPTDSIRSDFTPKIDSLDQISEPDSAVFAGYLTIIKALYIENPVSAKDLTLQTLKKAELAGMTKVRFLCNNYLALIYLELSDYNAAQQKIIENKTLLTQLQDPSLQVKLQSTNGLFYYAQGIYEEALVYMHKSLDYWQKLDNRKEIAKVQNNIGAMFLEMNENDSALNYFNSALEHKRLLDDKTSLAFTVGNLGSLYRQIEQPEKALTYLLEAEQLNLETNQKANLSLVKRLLSNVYLTLGEEKKAYTYLQEAEKYAVATASPKMHFLIYKEFANYYESLQDYDEAYSYLSKYSELKDSVTNAEKSYAIHQLKLDHENRMKNAQLKISDQQLRIAEAEKERSELIRYFLIALTLAAILIAFFVVRNVKIKAKRRREMYDHRKQIEELQMEKLLSEIEHKNRKLTSTALEIIRKNDSLAKIKDELNLLQNQVAEDEKKSIKQINTIIDYSFDTDRNWEDFRLAFEQVHTNFFNKIMEINPSLSPAEIKLCALLRLNFSSKEIGNLLGISPDSVKTSRSRLRKKLQLERENNLVEFMIAL